MWLGLNGLTFDTKRVVVRTTVIVSEASRVTLAHFGGVHGAVATPLT